MVGKLWPMELCTKIEEYNRKMIDTEEFLETTGMKDSKKRWFVDVTTSNGPADWIQKEIKDSLAMTEMLKSKIDSGTRLVDKTVTPDGLRAEYIFVDELNTWKKDKKDVVDALTNLSTAATTAAKNLNNTAFSLEARRQCEKRREEMERNEKEKENNMFINDPVNESQSYYNAIKNYIRVESMSMTQSPDEYPEIEIRGYIPQNALCNTMKKEYDKMYKNAPKMPKPTGIIRRDNTTRVDWDDKTYTIIVLEEGKEDLDMFHTFCIAFTKKMMGSTTNIMKAIEENDTDTINRKRAEAIEKANKEAEEETKKLKAKVEKAAFEDMVKREMLEHKVREEAIRRLMKQEGADIRKTEKITDRFIGE